MPRIVHLTSTGPGISSATLFVIVIIVAVLGYVILERGGESKANYKSPEEHASQPIPTKTRAADTHDTSEAAEVPDTAHTADDNADTDVADTEPDYSDYSDYSADDETDYDEDLQKRHERKPAKSAVNRNKGSKQKSVQYINGGGPGSDAPGTALTDVHEFSSYGSGSKNHWAANEHLKGRQDPRKDPVQPTWNSNLSHFRALLEGKTALLEQMDEVESLVFENWSTMKDGTLQTDPEWNRRRKVFLADDWVPQSRWGHVPKIIGNICKEILAAGVIDISALAGAMMEEPGIRNCSCNPASHIIQAGFKEEEADGVKRWVETSARGPQEILLGWFVLPYKGYEIYLWTQPGKYINEARYHHRSILKAVGEPASSILLWLSWAGHRYLANRLFSLKGADLLDGTLRVAVSKHTLEQGVEFRFDVTMFVPETKVMYDSKFHFSKERAQKGAFWLYSDLPKPALSKSLNLAREWIDYHFPDKGNAESPFSRITMRRLIFRPGYNNYHVDIEKSRPDQSSDVTLFHDTRPAVLMQLNEDAIKIAAGYGSLKAVMRFLNISVIKFINRRQNSWYISEEADKSADNFDTVQMALMMGLLKGSMGTFPTHASSELRAVYTFTENTWDNAYANNIDIDFGGMMPFVPYSEGELGVCFPWAQDLKRSGTFYIPLMTDQDQPTHMVYPGMTAVENKDLIFWTTEWIAHQTSLSKWATPSTTYAIVSGPNHDVEKELWKDLERVVLKYMMAQETQDDMYAYGSRILKGLKKSFALTTEASCQMTNVYPELEKVNPKWIIEDMVRQAISKGKQPGEVPTRQNRTKRSHREADPPGEASEMAAAQALNDRRTEELNNRQIDEALQREAAESSKRIGAGNDGKNDVTKQENEKVEETQKLDAEYEKKSLVWGEEEQFNEAWSKADFNTRKEMLKWRGERQRRERESNEGESESS